MVQILDFLIPPKCVYCGAYNSGEFCKFCFEKLENIEPESFVTRKKSLNWEIELIHKEECPLEKVYYFYYYNKIIHQIISEIKYQGNKKRIQLLIDILKKSKEFQKIDFNEFDYLTYVPISKEKENIRGFNQCQLLTQEIAKLKNKQYFTILEKYKNTKSQVDLTREQRLKNLVNCFIAKEKIPVDIKGKNILLIDDICSTGTTLMECAKVIKTEHPKCKLYGLCIARGKD